MVSCSCFDAASSRGRCYLVPCSNQQDQKSDPLAPFGSAVGDRAPSNLVTGVQVDINSSGSLFPGCIPKFRLCVSSHNRWKTKPKKYSFLEKIPTCNEMLQWHKIYFYVYIQGKWLDHISLKSPQWGSVPKPPPPLWGANFAFQIADAMLTLLSSFFTEVNFNDCVSPEGTPGSSLYLYHDE